MKKTTKHIIITMIAILALIAAAVLVYVWPMFFMDPFPTSVVPGTNITAIDNKKNSLYFIPTEGDSYIVVDAGSNTSEIEANMKEQGLDPAAVSSVLLTHTDSDHTAALSLFSNADIYMSADEQQMIDGTTKRNLLTSNELSEDTKSRIILVDENEVLELGDYTITCHKVPGHTPGSMAFVVDNQYLFSGDATRIHSSSAKLHPYTMDKRTGQESIDKLLELDISDDGMIFTAHYGVYKIEDIIK